MTISPGDPVAVEPRKHPSSSSPLTIGVVRELFRNLRQWEALYSSSGLDVIEHRKAHTSYHLMDIQYLYECRRLLSPRQREAIELCLYNDYSEKDAAILMGISPTNPVAMYATKGIASLIAMVESGKLERFRAPALGAEDRN